MILLPLVAAISLVSAADNRPANPIVNGSFEELAPGGFPAGWGPLGKVEVVGDAHSGKRALRLVRTTEPQAVETGVNSQNLSRLRGGIDFYYKAVAAKDAVLHIYGIPMGADGIEKTGSPRAAFAVPKQHVGDGQWHHARLKYDFTDKPAVKSVIFASRLEGTSGELLLDDFSYLQRVGPLLRIGNAAVDEDAGQPGRRGVIRAPVENAGDELAKDVRAAVTLAAGLSSRPNEIRLGDLAPDAKVPVAWTLDGERLGPSSLGIRATSGKEKATAQLDLAARLVLRSFGPTSPVATAGQPVSLECVLANPGTAILLNPSVEFTIGDRTQRASVPRIPPGRSATLRAAFDVPEATASLAAIARVGKETARTSVVVAAPARAPAPTGRLHASATQEAAVLENEHVRLVFSRSPFGFGPGEIQVRTGSSWATVAWLPRLSRVVDLDERGARRVTIPLLTKPPQAENEANGRARLQFVWSPVDREGPPGRPRIEFELKADAKTIACRYELAVDKPTKLLAFDGPMLYAPARDEAIFPGLEWLIGDELSSGSLDIVESHPDRIRYVVHPNYVTIPAIGVHSAHGTVGLLWDVHQKWDGTRDRPSAVFASPDRFENQRTHLMGLFLPTVPEYVKVNDREAESQKPYLLEPGKSIRLKAQIYADGAASDALSAIDQWAKTYGFPKPAPLPHGSYEREIEFSMQAYLKSLWVPEEQKWWTTKGGGMMSTKDCPRTFVADLLVGDLLSPDAGIRRQCRARAEEVLKLIGGQPRLDAQRFAGRMDSGLADPSPAAGLLMSRGDDGAWRFNADQVGTGPFVGLDYHDLGPNNAAEVGLCAAKATAVLRYARITGDWAAYRQMQKTLEFMERFRVPRAAQVWEVPVHTPDILAAAEAAEAFIEAYRFSRDPRWLRDAVVWARRGLPFVYFWNDPQRPFLVGASIPVFGATWMQGSWFGRPVQWNGLRYAEAILKLAEYDQSCPWRQIATAITHSAILQQDTEGENVALWPDNVGAVKGDKCPWVFSPQMILANVLKLLGRDPDLATVILGEGEKRLHVSAAAKLTAAVWDGNRLTLRATYPRGEQGVVVVFNTAKPQAVVVDGKPLVEREDLESGPEPGWRYDEGIAGLSVRIVRDGQSAVRIDGARFRQVTRLARLADRIAFEFTDSLEGWIAMHQVADLAVREGTLAGKITGPDPYLGRSMLRVRGDDCPVIVLRMRVTAGGGGQCFWMTESSPAFTEDKSVRFNVQPDGEFHEYRLEVGKHPAWSGQTITGIRIDPSDGAPGGEFAIDYVRTEGGK